MMRSTLKITISTSLIFLISFESCFSETIPSCNFNSGEGYQNCRILLAKNAQEESYIKQSKEAAKSSTNQAMFVVHRIKCLNSSGQAALHACNKALSINPNVAAIKKRRAVLSNQLKPKPASKIVRKVDKAPIKPVPTPRSVPLPRKPLIQTQTIKKPSLLSKKKRTAQNNDTRIIKQIQKILLHLGFDIGQADGVAGKKTRQAIKNFQNITRSKRTSRLNKRLLIQLQKAQKQHINADQKYKLAKEELSGENLEKSLQIIENSLNKAPWHLGLKSLRKEVKQQIALKPESNQEQQVETQLDLKREELDIIIELAHSQLDVNEIESATSTINKGLSIDPQNESLLRLKRTVTAHKKEQIKISKIITESLRMFSNNEFNNSLSLIEEGLVLDSNHPDLLEIKRQVLAKQKVIQAQEEKDKKLSNLYASSLEKFRNNEFDSVLTLVDEGLILDSNHKSFIELKRQVLAKQKEIRVKKDNDNKLSNLYASSLEKFRNNEFDSALTLVDEGLILNSNHQSFLELKRQILAKQKEIEVKMEKDKKISNLYANSLEKFHDNEIDGALVLVDEGLSLDSNNLSLIELKRDIILKKEEIVSQKKANQKVARLLNLIEERQGNLAVLDNKILVEQQPLLDKAQQTLEKFHSR